MVIQISFNWVSYLIPFYYTSDKTVQKHVSFKRPGLVGKTKDY